jgi:hypothetical protein
LLGRTEPPICTVGLLPHEVDWINNVTQVYTRDHLFYRKQPPRVTDSFRAREFRICDFRWLEDVIETVASYLPPDWTQCYQRDLRQKCD